MTFAETIERIKREVRDLKTACQHAFGTMNFYKRSVIYTQPGNQSYANSFITITATAKSGEVAPFFCQLAFSGTQDLIATSLTTSSTSIKWVYYYNPASATTLTFTGIATSDFTINAQQGQH